MSPDPQFVQAAVPDAALYVAAGQLLQTAEDVVAVNIPATQLAQVGEPTTEYIPTPQGEHEVT